MCGIRDYRLIHDEHKEKYVLQVHSPPQKTYLSQIFIKSNAANWVGTLRIISFYWSKGTRVWYLGEVGKYELYEELMPYIDELCGGFHFFLFLNLFSLAFLLCKLLWLHHLFIFAYEFFKLHLVYKFEIVWNENSFPPLSLKLFHTKWNLEKSVMCD